MRDTYKDQSVDLSTQCSPLPQALVSSSGTKQYREHQSVSRGHLSTNIIRVPPPTRPMKYTVSENSSTTSVSPVSSSAKMTSPAVRRRSPLESRLIFIVLGLSVALVSLSITLVILSGLKMKWDTGELGGQVDTCMSEECIVSAARILKSIDRSADPCTDFYQYACGGWVASNPVPDEYSVWDQFRLLREQLLYDIKAILESPSNSFTPKPVHQARLLYRACLDEDRLEELGVAPLLQLLRSLGLPEVPAAPGTRPALPNLTPEWLTAMSRSQKTLSSSVIFSLFVSEDLRNTSRNVIMLDQASPGFSERYLADPTRFAREVADYKSYVTDMISSLLSKIPNSSLNASQLANEVVAFSTELSLIMTPAEERRDLSAQSEEMSVEKLQKLTDAPLNATTRTNRIDWAEYLRDSFHGSNVTLESDDMVVVMDSAYLEQRYLWWRVFSALAPLTLREFREHASRLGQRVMGHNTQAPRWRTCASSVNTNFGMAVSFDYVLRHFQEHSRFKALEMVNDIQVAFENMVHELDWMDHKTKQLTLQKARSMRPFIGFPEWLLVPGELEKYYEGVDVLEGQLFATYVGLSATGAKRTLEDLRRTPDKNRFIATPTTVNAFYSPVLNSITFPAGLLHPPFYGLGLEALNYGAIGAIMGHELTHGFDDLGRQYDLHGNLKQWWTNNTLNEYNDRVQCIIDQYSEFHVTRLGDNFTVNGVNTQGENIADNGGLREAQRAYEWFRERQRRQHRRRHRVMDVEPSLPGLEDISPEQLFYLGFAHSWTVCTVQTDSVSLVPCPT
ncbi:hypothetical protein B566_EDAN006950 [Ephemera danica]|nr:hypothetical protein B566_EDAN006950 [Ephemera danica]